MQRGRVSAHKLAVKNIVGQSHIDLQADDKADISEEVIVERLKKASGANYDLGSNASGYSSQAADIGKAAAAKYKALEKETNIGPIIFEKFDKPKDYVTPMELGGRPMVAPPAAAKKNIIVRDEAAVQPSVNASSYSNERTGEVKSEDDSKSEADIKTDANLVESEETTHLSEQMENCEAKEEASADPDDAEEKALDLAIDDNADCELNHSNAEELAEDGSINASNELRDTEVDEINATESDSANDEKDAGDDAANNADADAADIKTIELGAPDLIRQHSSAAMLNSEASAMTSVATAA